MTASPRNRTCAGRQSLGSVAIRPILTSPTTDAIGATYDEGNEGMNRVVVGLVGLATAAAVAVGFSDNKGGSASRKAAGSLQVRPGWKPEVKGGGKGLSGL